MGYSLSPMATRPWPANPSVRFAIEGKTAGNVNWANVFWATCASASTPTPANLNSLASQLYSCYSTGLLGLLGNDLSQQRCVVNFYGAPGTQVVGEYATTNMGGSDNPTEVDSLSACISWQFPATWRGGKPRTYMPGLPSEAFETSNTLASAFQTALLSAAAGFRADVNASAAGPVSAMVLSVMSFFSGNSPRALGVAFPITGEVVHPRIDSMRRRLGKEIT